MKKKKNKMTPYLFAFLGPIIILVLNYLFANETPKTFTDYLNVLFCALPHLWGYMFFIYFLGMENYIDTGYAPITLVTFLTPITVIAILLKIFFWIKAQYFGS